MNKIKNHEASRERDEKKIFNEDRSQKEGRKIESAAQWDRNLTKESNAPLQSRKHIIKIIKTFMNDVLYKRLKETRDRLLYTMNKHEWNGRLRKFNTFVRVSWKHGALCEKKKRKWNEIILECPIQYYTQFYLICCFIIIDTSNYNTSTLGATHFFLQ